MRISKKAILEGLRALYPDAGPELHFRDPYETLVAVMLSAQCTDKQVNKVTPALFERYPTVRDMAAASVEDVYPMVKSCGFKTKAANIVSACRLIMQNHGGEVPGAMEALTALPGVGRKTANVVLANAFGVPTIAVDTHVFRVSNRLGLVHADDVLQTELQLQQVMLNLMINAIDAMENNPGEQILTIEAGPASSSPVPLEPPPERGTVDPADYLFIRVTDNGSGMTDETRKKLFEPFFTTKPVGQGTGMGLAMAYGIISNHQGWIQFESAPGKGTSFYLFLPFGGRGKEEARA